MGRWQGLLETRLFEYQQDRGLMRGRSWSVLPKQSLAAGDPWDDVLKTMREREAGKGDKELEVVAGGELVVVDRDNVTQDRSVLPKDRLAVSKPWISTADVKVVQRLDPHNVEGWQPIYTPQLDGWRFSLTPRPGGTKFVFLAFRSPNDGGHWRVWVMFPDYDARYGHQDHIISVEIGGRKIPVICANPGMAACKTLEEVRATTSKWALHAEARLSGRTPGFS